MSIDSKYPNRPFVKGAPRPLMTSLISFSIILLLSSPIGATGFPVIDISHQVNNVVTQIGTRVQEAAQFAKDNTQYAREWQQIQDSYTNVKNIFELQAMPQNFDMTERAENFGVKERCPGVDPGFSLTGMIDRALPDNKKSIPAQQAQICAKIVIIENRKHNELVKMFKTGAQRAKEAAAVAKNARASRTSGDQQSNVQQAQSVANAAQADAMTSSGKLQAYDAMIVSLKNDQTLLAKQALKGDSSAIGAIIKTTALAGALKVNKTN